MVSYESARKALGQQLEKLQQGLQNVNNQIVSAQREMELHQQQKDQLLTDIRELAAALTALGGPIPDWTEDKALIAFWDEVKDSDD